MELFYGRTPFSKAKGKQKTPSDIEKQSHRRDKSRKFGVSTEASGWAQYKAWRETRRRSDLDDTLLDDIGRRERNSLTKDTNESQAGLASMGSQDGLISKAKNDSSLPVDVQDSCPPRKPCDQDCEGGNGASHGPTNSAGARYSADRAKLNLSPPPPSRIVRTDEVSVSYS